MVLSDVIPEESSSDISSLSSHEPSTTSLNQQESRESNSLANSQKKDKIDGLLNDSLSPNTDPIHRKSHSIRLIRDGPDETTTHFDGPPRDSSPTKCNTLPRQSQSNAVDPAQTHSNAVEQTDSDMRHYITMLKRRGHKRTFSAPVPTSPPSGVNKGRSTDKTKHMEENDTLSSSTSGTSSDTKYVIA